EIISEVDMFEDIADDHGVGVKHEEGVVRAVDKGKYLGVAPAGEQFPVIGCGNLTCENEAKFFVVREVGGDCDLTVYQKGDGQVANRIADALYGSKTILEVSFISGNIDTEIRG